MSERFNMESQKLVSHLTEYFRKSLTNLGKLSCSKEDLKRVANEKDSGWRESNVFIWATITEYHRLGRL